MGRRSTPGRSELRVDLDAGAAEPVDLLEDSSRFGFFIIRTRTLGSVACTET